MRIDFPLKHIINISELDIEYHLFKVKDGNDNIIMNNMFSEAFNHYFPDWKVMVCESHLYFYNVNLKDVVYLFSGNIEFCPELKEKLYFHDSKNFSLIKPFKMEFNMWESDSVVHAPYCIKAEGSLRCLSD